MNVSEHFSLRELTQSQTATRRGIDNSPSADHLAALRMLCENVLEPVRDHFGKPIRVTSAYRSPRLNAAIGGSASSQHCLGEAADIEITGVENKRLAKWIRDNLPFDQLILEGASATDPNAGWVHVSFRDNRQRKSVLTATFVGGRARYSEGLA